MELGLRSRSAPINMHYNLAQGVHWKGYPITPLKVPLKMSESLGRCNTAMLQHCKTRKYSVKWLRQRAALKQMQLLLYISMFDHSLFLSLLPVLCFFCCFFLRTKTALSVFHTTQEQTRPRIDRKLTCTVLVIYMVMQDCASHFIIASFSVSSLQRCRAVNTSCVSR